MTDQPIDPAATPEDPDAPEIAAADAGTGAAAERLSKQGERIQDVPELPPGAVGGG